MGSYDGAEIGELVGLFTLNHPGGKFGKENIVIWKPLQGGAALYSKDV
jgi:hypothetical protein